MTAASQPQFKPNASFPPPPTAGSISGHGYPPSSQNGVSQFTSSTDSTPNQVSPGHQIGHPGQQFSPPGNQVASSGHQVAPSGHQVAPPGHQVAPPGHQVAPLGHQVAPPGHQAALLGQGVPPRISSYGPPRPSSGSAFSPVTAPPSATTPMGYPSMGLAAPPQQMQPPPSSMQPPSQFSRTAYTHPPQNSGGAYPPSPGFPPTAGAPAPHMNRGYENHADESAQYPQPPMARHPEASPYNHIQQGMQQPMQAQYQRKLDPDQMPNPVSEDILPIVKAV